MLRYHCNLGLPVHSCPVFDWPLDAHAFLYLCIKQHPALGLGLKNKDEILPCAKPGLATTRTPQWCFVLAFCTGVNFTLRELVKYSENSMRDHQEGGIQELPQSAATTVLPRPAQFPRGYCPRCWHSKPGVPNTAHIWLHQK